VIGRPGYEQTVPSSGATKWIRYSWTTSCTHSLLR